ncbi:MAG: hypothetical protein A3J83_06780 [Elusimicrobia bacterium RIFOXYA2_FULL_40_6]|nr:MAG: hypothetical protein A3J83_06780 [Elusimicrobia bacterium RIFOXYA2_FULL_40_6]
MNAVIIKIIRSLKVFSKTRLESFMDILSQYVAGRLKIVNTKPVFNKRIFTFRPCVVMYAD